MYNNISLPLWPKSALLLDTTLPQQFLLFFFFLLSFSFMKLPPMETHSCHASLLLPVYISHYKQHYTHGLELARAQAGERPGTSVLHRLQDRDGGAGLHGHSKSRINDINFLHPFVLRIRENQLKSMSIIRRKSFSAN